MDRGRVLVGAAVLAFLTGLPVADLMGVNGAVPKDARQNQLPDDLLKLRKADSDFDYFVFSQQWPGTYCQKSSACCQDVELPVNFTVHGLWPENEDGSYPSCCSGPGFDQDKIDELEDLLQRYWPTFSCSSPQQCNGKKTGTFWQHEWEKHGTCAYPTIPDEATYFTVGLNLRLKYDISAILKSSGFVPSSSASYRTSDVIAAVEGAVGAQPTFSCTSGQINEIWICFTKDLTIRDCGPASSCPTTLRVPPFEDDSVEDQ